MTWLKVSDDFGDDCARVQLSDAGFRTHVEALCWTMRRETGGRIDAIDLRRFAESERAAEAVQELLDAGFWSRTDSGYMVVHHMEHQPETDVIAKRRKNDAERQRRKRRKDAGLPPDEPASRRDSRRDNPRDPGRVGSGRDGVTSTAELRLKEEQEQPNNHDQNRDDPWAS
jgi:hypothetical protein